MLRCIALMIVSTVAALPAFAGEADILDVKVDPLGDRTFEFHVTVEHFDDGWDHHANGWQVLSPNGDVLGMHEINRPHVEENPFTRSDVFKVPVGVSEVTLRARDLVHGFGGKEITVTLPAD